MSNEVATLKEGAIQSVEVLQTVDMATITEYLDSTGLTKQLLPKEKAMFVNMAQLYGLNPFKREIYCTVYGEGQYRQCSIITGYEVYLKRAERIGKLDGWNTTEIGSIKEGNFGVKVTIYRKDWKYPFEHTAYYSEVRQTKKDGTPNKFWATQPRFMTKKVAVCQAFRMCFPDEFGGMPYMADELGVDEKDAPQVERNVTPAKEPPAEEPKAIEKPVVVEEKAKEPSDAFLTLEQMLTEHGMDLHGTPYKLASECLKNPQATDDDYKAMYKRCVTYLTRKGIQVA